MDLEERFTTAAVWDKAVARGLARCSLAGGLHISQMLEAEHETQQKQ